MRSNRRVEAADPLARRASLTATRTLRREPRNPGQKGVEQALASAAHLRREPVRLLQQGVGVDPVAVELMAIGLDPALHDLGRHLGVKLQPKVSSHDVSLWGDSGLGDQPGARRKRESVEMPVEPRSLGDQLGVIGAHWQPADLPVFRAERFAPEHASQQLSTEAQPEHRDIGLRRSAQKIGFARDERFGVVERRELGTEGCDEVVVARIVCNLVQIDAMDVDIRLLFLEPFREVPRRCRLFVLQDQDLELASHRTGLGSSFVSSSLATLRTDAPKRSTISPSSASVLVKGGANSVWSPANPSRVGIVEYVMSPFSKATSSTVPAARSSGGRKDLPSRGSTYSTPSRKPRPRTSCTIETPLRDSASCSRRRGPRSRTRAIRPSFLRTSMTLRPTAQDRGAPSHVWPRVNFLDPLAIAS